MIQMIEYRIVNVVMIIDSHNHTFYISNSLFLISLHPAQIEFKACQRYVKIVINHKSTFCKKLFYFHLIFFEKIIFSYNLTACIRKNDHI